MLKLKLQFFDHLMQRANSLEKTLMLGKIEEKRVAEDEMVGWHHHHRLNGHEFEQSPGDCERQGSLVCFSSWGRKESDTTERLNNKEFYIIFDLRYFVGSPVLKTPCKKKKA